MDCIVKVIGVDHETVIECVTQNKCDDLAAMYHMIEHNYREVQNVKFDLRCGSNGQFSLISHYKTEI